MGYKLNNAIIKSDRVNIKKNFKLNIMNQIKMYKKKLKNHCLLSTFYCSTNNNSQNK